ncbi:LysR family transcriptional regulator [Streptomyces sp. NPDC020996]|uniref:LysR family transcriptional regulator n=1 Tax=Streptomyces sp. NPDC020996 TaxID=3154791 RepID=UPI0034017A55
MRLANMNLNLLVSLAALLDQRSVTRAAQQLGLSQPSLSASLSQLRRHFGDELLTRVGNEYRLTPLAEQLKPWVRLALDDAERVFSARLAFDAKETTREFSVILSDYACVVLGNPVAELLGREAPNARLRLVHSTTQAVDQAEQTLLTADLMVVPHGFVTDLPHADVLTDTWVVVASADNPDVGDTLTVEQLEALPWVATYHGLTSSTSAARQMRILGIEPRVQVVTESFLAVPDLVAGTRRIALLQERLVRRLPADAGIRALPCPFGVGPLVDAMWWHPVHHGDAEHVFFRGLVLRAAEQVRGEPGGPPRITGP